VADTVGWLQVPVVATIAAAFFLIEKMAIHLQDPFENRPTDTPMVTISNTIEMNLMQMVQEYRNEMEIANGVPVSMKNIQAANPYFVL
jgi:putative membrane protein